MAFTGTIRVATPADKDAVAAVLTASYPALMSPAYDEAVLAAALPLMTRPNPALLDCGTYYLAVTERDGVVGCGGWTRERPENSEVIGELAHIRHFGTHPAHIRRGIGRALFDRCAEVAAAAGMRRFECNAGLNAVSFYAALGFRTVRLVEIPMGPDVRLPSLVMERPI